MDPLTIGGLIFTGATVASLLGLHLAKVKVPRVGRWSSPPDVLVSSSAPVKMGDVRKAVDFWRDRGFELGAVRPTPTIAGPVAGHILIAPADRGWRDGKAGRATWLTEYPLGDDELGGDLPEDDYLSHAHDIIEAPEGVIKHAVISLDPLAPKWDHFEILVHELGHALGFLHCETALFGRRKKDSKSGKRKKGDAKLRVIGRKTGHVMNPLLSKMGTGKNSTKGMTPP